MTIRSVQSTRAVRRACRESRPMALTSRVDRPAVPAVMISDHVLRFVFLVITWSGRPGNRTNMLSTITGLLSLWGTRAASSRSVAAEGGANDGGYLRRACLVDRLRAQFKSQECPACAICCANEHQDEICPPRHEVRRDESGEGCLGFQQFHAICQPCVLGAWAWHSATVAWARQVSCFPRGGDALFMSL
jgi:hypothetical protein